jgi:hypothetical protein
MESEESDPTTEAPDAPELDDQIIGDLESKYAGVLCPVHGVPPSFDVDEKGSMIERFCCEGLMQIFRELQETDPGDAAEPDAKA